MKGAKEKAMKTTEEERSNEKKGITEESMKRMEEERSDEKMELKKINE